MAVLALADCSWHAEGRHKLGMHVHIATIAVHRHRHISRLFAAFQLVAVGAQNLLLDLQTAIGIDRMRDIGMQLQPGMAVAVPVLREAGLAVLVEP